MTPPGTRNVGEVILRDLCALLPRDSLAVCDVGPAPPVELDVPYRHVPAPDERAWRPLSGRAGGLANHVRVRGAFRRAVASARRQVEGFAREQRAERLLVALNSQAMNAMGAGLASATGLPMSVIVWDPPHATAINQGWDSASARWADERFSEAMRAADAAMVVSEEMVEDYGQRFGLRCEVVRHALPVMHATRPMPPEGRIRIGFAGTLYDSAQLDRLLQALNACQWRLQGREVVLRMIGNYYRFTALTAPAQVELLGWQGAEETTRLLAECEFNYLPIAFLPGFGELARLAFPSKLGNFLAAGRPVLVHAPEGSTSMRFARAHGFGETCTSMQVESLGEALARICDPSRHAQCLEAVERTRQRFFTPAVMRSAFARFLAVPESELLQ
jgi:hypothetical protein